MLEPVLLRTSPICPRIPGPDKRRLGFRELGSDFGLRVHPFPTIPTRSSTHDALVKQFMDLKEKTVGKSDLGASPEAKGWRDVLQLLREQTEKIGQGSQRQGMLRNNPGHVNNAPPRKGWVSFGDRTLRLWENPKKAHKGGERVAPSPPKDRTLKKRKGSSSPTYAAATSLREASGQSLIAGDFNSKSPEWGEARLDRRGT